MPESSPTPEKPWAILGMTRKQYAVARPWKKAGMGKEKYAEMLNLIPHDAMQILKDEAEAESAGREHLRTNRKRTIASIHRRTPPFSP